VFADARQTFAADALLALVARFEDPRVGGVSGELILGAESAAGRRSNRDRRTANAEWLAQEQRAGDRRLSSTVSDGER